MLKILAALALLPPVSGAAAQVPSDPVQFDLQCLLASSMLVEAEDETVRIAGLIAANYFLGRVDARIQATDLEARLLAEVRAMTPEHHLAMLRSCGAVMRERGQHLQQIGARMQQLGRPRT